MKQDFKLFDQRTFQRNLKLGLIKQEDYQKFLKSLPDDEANAAMVRFEDLDPPISEPSIPTLDLPLDDSEGEESTDPFED